MSNIKVEKDKQIMIIVKDWSQLCGNLWQGDAQVPRWSGTASHSR